MPEVRLVGPNGETVGIVATGDALRLAQEADLDLVEVAPQARPPVCKLMDYGKFKYENAQKARESRRNQTNTVIKEMKLRPKIDAHDYETKKGHVVRFLRQGDKVKITIMFRGREQHRPELGFRLLQRLAEDVEELGFVEATPKQDGRNMTMVLGAAQEEGRGEGRGEGGQAGGRRRPRGRAGRGAGEQRAAPTRCPRAEEGTTPLRGARSRDRRLSARRASACRSVPAGTDTRREDEMPKNKTHSGASKRFRVTGSGKILRARRPACATTWRRSPPR